MRDALTTTAILQANFPDAIISIHIELSQHVVVIKKHKAKEALGLLHKELLFNHLQDLTAIDWFKKKTPRFELIYQLYSIPYKIQLRLKVPVAEDDCTIETVCDIWQTANWLERECYDMFGIVFKGHPDLRRILLPEDWVGHPLRKDYSVEGDVIWKGYKDLLEGVKGN